MLSRLIPRVDALCSRAEEVPGHNDSQDQNNHLKSIIGPYFSGAASAAAKIAVRILAELSQFPCIQLISRCVIVNHRRIPVKPGLDLSPRPSFHLPQTPRV